MELHQYAKKLGLEHKCFTRYTSHTNIDSDDNTDVHNNRNIIEQTLDVILTEIDNNNDGNSSDGQKQYVEYWTRQEWRHIEAHADVDENLSRHKEDDDILKDVDLQSKYASTYQQKYGHRYPIFGHVLYLQVGTDVRGPTVVFPNRSSGGDLLKDMKDPSISEEEECSSEGENGVSMSIIPAVEGRLLRFDGRDLHTVPRPTDIWMLPFVKGGAEYEPEGQWGRSVILFNVWPGSEDPPLDVPLDIKHDDQPTKNTQTTELCNSYSNWKEVANDIPTTNDSDDTAAESNQSVKIWLLGNERRRDHPLRTVPLLSPKDGGRNVVRKALSEESKVTELLLRRK